MIGSVIVFLAAVLGGLGGFVQTWEWLEKRLVVVSTPAPTSILIPTLTSSSVPSASHTNAPSPTLTPWPSTETPTSPTLTPTPPPLATPPTLTGLSPETVRSWCQGADCTPERFEQPDPNVVHMRAGRPVAITVPQGQGYLAQVWDCFNYNESSGGHFPQVCVMSVRKSP